MNVKSEPGAGTTFEVYLPRATTRPSDAEKSAPAALPRGEGELILLVDDENSVREMLRATLLEQGYQVVTASSGTEGLAVLAQSNGSVRLVLLDIGMPGMDGMETFSGIRVRNPRLPVVLMSADATRLPENENDPATACLLKPFSAEQLLQLLRSLIVV